MRQGRLKKLINGFSDGLWLCGNLEAGLFFQRFG